MFHLIEPQEHHLYESSITSFLQDLQDSIGLEKDKDLTQATFLLVRKDIEGINGGIMLCKQSIFLLHPEIREYLQSFCPQLKEIWTGMIALQMSEDIAGRDFDKICQILYRALYEDLIVFGIREQSPFLCLTMDYIEHLTINLLGLWPYVLEVKPNVSSKGLFHGVLALNWTPQAANLYWEHGEDLHFLDSKCAFQAFSDSRL